MQVCGRVLPISKLSIQRVALITAKCAERMHVVELGPTWDLHGTYLGPTWDLPGTYLGPTWNLPGTYLGPTWDLPGKRQCYQPSQRNSRANRHESAMHQSA